MVKIRKNWGSVKPVTKVKQSDKKYNRKKLELIASVFNHEIYITQWKGE